MRSSCGRTARLSHCTALVKATAAQGVCSHWDRCLSRSTGCPVYETQTLYLASKTILVISGSQALGASCLSLPHSICLLWLTLNYSLRSTRLPSYPLFSNQILSYSVLSLWLCFVDSKSLSLLVVCSQQGWSGS